MLPAHFNRSGRPLIWAHRGASAEAPENTIAAFSLALAEDADGIELDAQRCASGEVVVLHDESLARTTGFAAPVTHASYSVLRTLDAGSWKADRFRGERIPLLAGPPNDETCTASSPCSNCVLAAACRTCGCQS